MAFCPKCGKQLQDGAAFCGACGARASNDNIGVDIPVFTPPKQQDIPVFTPPQETVPTFQPPRGTNSAAVCFHHPLEPAVAQCARCGKYICKDCSEAYGVVSGEYAGKCLCFDCCEELVSQNVQELTQNKQKIKTQFIISLIGIVIGFFAGLAAGIAEGSFFGGIGIGLFYACIGGVFLSALKMYFQSMWEAIKMCFSGEYGWVAAIAFLLVRCFIIAFKCIVGTVSNTIYYINYLKKTSGFIEQDSAALQQMRDYMEYTLVRSQNKGVDLDSLMKEGSQLYNNTYAQAVRDSGEQAADAALRQATTRIAENGEIIRDFRSAA